jgi:hypothetical protein
VVVSRIASYYPASVRASFAFGAVVLLLTAAGCGTSKQTAGSDDSPTNTAAQKSPPADEQRGFAWSRSMAGDELPSTDELPLVKQLAVFETQVEPTDALPQPPIEDPFSDDDLPEKYRPGRVLSSQSRHLLSEEEPRRLSLFAAPSEKGWVCAYLIDPKDELSGVSGECIHGLLSERVFFWMSGTESRYEVYGLAANDVRRVLVVAKGERHPAVVGRNGFLFEARPTDICPTDIDYLVVEGKGWTHKITLAEPGAPSELEPDVDYGC